MRVWFRALWTRYWERKLGLVGDRHLAEMDAIRETLIVVQKRERALRP